MREAVWIAEDRHWSSDRVLPITKPYRRRQCNVDICDGWSTLSLSVTVWYGRDVDDEETEAVKPKLMFNPHLQRLYQVTFRPIGFVYLSLICQSSLLYQLTVVCSSAYWQKKLVVSQRRDIQCQLALVHFCFMYNVSSLSSVYKFFV